MYLFFGAFPLVFGKGHDFTLSQVGLTFLGIFVGMILGIASDPLWRKNYARLMRNYEKETGQPGKSEPEFRLPPTILGAWIVPIALFGKSHAIPMRASDSCVTTTHGFLKFGFVFIKIDGLRSFVEKG